MDNVLGASLSARHAPRAGGCPAGGRARAYDRRQIVGGRVAWHGVLPSRRSREGNSAFGTPGTGVSGRPFSPERSVYDILRRGLLPRRAREELSYLPPEVRTIVGATTSCDEARPDCPRSRYAAQGKRKREPRVNRQPWTSGVTSSGETLP